MNQQWNQMSLAAKARETPAPRRFGAAPRVDVGDQITVIGVS